MCIPEDRQRQPAAWRPYESSGVTQPMRTGLSNGARWTFTGRTPAVATTIPQGGIGLIPSGGGSILR